MVKTLSIAAACGIALYGLSRFINRHVVFVATLGPLQDEEVSLDEDAAWATCPRHPASPAGMPADATDREGGELAGDVAVEGLPRPGWPDGDPQASPCP